MRKKILRLLEKGKELHGELISNYNNSLPANIIEDGNSIVYNELPAKINAILVILNADAKEIKYKPVSNLQQAIELFKDIELQNALDKATANKGLVGLSIYEDCLVTVQELLDTTKFEIESLIDLLYTHSGKSKTLQL